MKSILLFILFTCCVSVLIAQVPESINYQAIARDASNNPIGGATISVRFQILQGNSRGNSVYSETHFTTTNDLGLFNLAIGTGTPINGTFANIDWDNAPYYLELAIDPNGGNDFELIGVSQMHSVPYALRASCKCSIIVDGDNDTWIETNPAGSDLDEIHMSLGQSPNGTPGVEGPTVLKLRLNNATSKNTLLELIDGAGTHNTFIGESAGNGSTGADNTAIGYKAFQNNGNGNKNTAFGVNAMYWNASGSDNVAIGYGAMYFNGTGALGSNARFNTAVGATALYKNTDGRQNTAIGNNALFQNDHGDYNTGIGVNALANTTNGKYNTAVGVFSLYNNKGNDRSTALGYGAMINADNNAIGRETYNTAVGFEALRGSLTPANNTGQWNTAIGDEALKNNSSGLVNTAIGSGALRANTTGRDNTATGSEALRLNSIGFGNTGNGYVSLNHNSTGDFNTGIGSNSLFYNDAGNENTALGVYSLYNNRANDRSTAVGFGALFRADNRGTPGRATYNTAVGYQAMYGSPVPENNTGRWNTALGDQALYSNETGDNNTAIGLGSLISNTNGSFNTAVGAGADVSTPDLTNATAIGYGAIASASNQIRLGNTSINAALPGNDNVATLGDNTSRWKEVWSGNGVIQTSDFRLKADISTTTYGLAEVMLLRPVRYYWKEKPEEHAMLGFIAQDVEGIVPEVVVAPKTEAEFYAMKYEGLIPVLTKAIQEQQAMIEQLSSIIEQQNLEIENLKKEFLLTSGKD